MGVVAKFGASMAKVLLFPIVQRVSQESDDLVLGYWPGPWLQSCLAVLPVFFCLCFLGFRKGRRLVAPWRWAVFHGLWVKCGATTLIPIIPFADSRYVQLPRDWSASMLSGLDS